MKMLQRRDLCRSWHNGTGWRSEWTTWFSPWGANPAKPPLLWGIFFHKNPNTATPASLSDQVLAFHVHRDVTPHPSTTWTTLGRSGRRSRAVLGAAPRVGGGEVAPPGGSLPSSETLHRRLKAKQSHAGKWRYPQQNNSSSEKDYLLPRGHFVSSLRWGNASTRQRNFLYNFQV